MPTTRTRRTRKIRQRLAWHQLEDYERRFVTDELTEDDHRRYGFKVFALVHGPVGANPPHIRERIEALHAMRAEHRRQFGTPPDEMEMEEPE